MGNRNKKLGVPTKLVRKKSLRRGGSRLLKKKKTLRAPVEPTEEEQDVNEDEAGTQCDDSMPPADAEGEGDDKEDVPMDDGSPTAEAQGESKG